MDNRRARFPKGNNTHQTLEQREQYTATKKGDPEQSRVKRRLMIRASDDPGLSVRGSRCCAVALSRFCRFAVPMLAHHVASSSLALQGMFFLLLGVLAVGALVAGVPIVVLVGGGCVGVGWWVSSWLVEVCGLGWLL